MELVLDITEIESKQVMENLKAILEATQMTFDNVVKAIIFIIKTRNFARINAEFRITFLKHKIARNDGGFQVLGFGIWDLVHYAN